MSCLLDSRDGWLRYFASGGRNIFTRDKDKAAFRPLTYPPYQDARRDCGQQESQPAGLFQRRTLFIETDGERDAIETC